MVTLALLRRFRLIDRDLRARAGWRAAPTPTGGHELGGRALGILGMGNVGRALFRIAHDGFGLEVIANTRTAAACRPARAPSRSTYWSPRPTSSCSAAR